MPGTLCRWSARAAPEASIAKAIASHRVHGARSTNIQRSIGIIYAFTDDLVLMDKHTSHWRLIGLESLLCLRYLSAEEHQNLWNKPTNSRARRIYTSCVD